MANMKKHFGRIKNTGQRCLVIYMQLPDQPETALVVQTDNLPTKYESFLMEIADSPEAQSTHKLYEVLNRRLDPATGKNILVSLHEARMLNPVSIDNVVMLPSPNMPFPLRRVLEGMAQQGTAIMPPKSDQAAIKQNLPEASFYEETKHNQFSENRRADDDQNRKAIARNLMFEAEMLQTEAMKKMETAYQYDPTLRPSTHKPTTMAMASADAMMEYNASSVTPPEVNNPEPSMPETNKPAKKAKSPRAPRKKATA